MQQKRLLSRTIAYPIFAITGFLFVFSLITGRELAKDGNILWSAGHTAFIFGVSLAAGGVAGILICLFFFRI